MCRLPDVPTEAIRLGPVLRTLVLLTFVVCSPKALSAFEQHAAHGGPVKGLALSPDGRWMVSTSFDYTAVLWSTADFSERRTLKGHQAAVNAAAFSPDGRYLVTAGDDRMLCVWKLGDLLDEDTQPVPTVLSGHTAKVVHLAFSADGRRLASSSWDHSVGIWSVPAFENEVFLSGHDAPVHAALFSNDGRALYSAGGDGHVRLWDVINARYVRSLVDNGWGINVLAIDEDRDWLAYGTANGAMRSISWIRAWNSVFSVAASDALTVPLAACVASSRIRMRMLDDSLSAPSVRTRFFTHTMSFPRKQVQKLTNVDYVNDLAIVGAVPGPGDEEIVALAEYFLDPKTRTAEVAFIVQDEWQRKGMGSFLMDYLAQIARQRGVRSFFAKVLPQNKAMLSVFQNSGYKLNLEFDGDAYSLEFELSKED